MEPVEEATKSPLDNTTNDEVVTQRNNIPDDYFNLAYIIYFILGTGFLLPWNTFISAVDYFHYLYPDRNVVRIFTIVYSSVSLLCLLIISCYNMIHVYIRINMGLGLFSLALLVVPLIDLVCRSGLHYGLYVTAGAMGVSGMSNAVVQGEHIGSAAELAQCYMQAVVSGASASGVVVSSLRIFIKAVYPQDIHGLRSSAILYFIVAIMFMMICRILYNLVTRLPVIKY